MGNEFGFRSAKAQEPYNIKPFPPRQPIPGPNQEDHPGLSEIVHMTDVIRVPNEGGPNFKQYFRPRVHADVPPDKPVRTGKLGEGTKVQCQQHQRQQRDGNEQVVGKLVQAIGLMANHQLGRVGRFCLGSK